MFTKLYNRNPPLKRPKKLKINTKPKPLKLDPPEELLVEGFVLV
jgi:hypothetical protein